MMLQLIVKTSHLILVAVMALCIAGCGAQVEFPTAPVSGRVTWNGMPVTEGEVQFTPKATGTNAGKAGAGIVGPDGTFQVSTYGTDDGAIVGSHTVTYTAPPPRPEQSNASQSSGVPSNEGPSRPSAFEGLVPEQAEVQIGSEGVTLEITLIKK